MLGLLTGESELQQCIQRSEIVQPWSKNIVAQTHHTPFVRWFTSARKIGASIFLQRKPFSRGQRRLSRLHPFPRTTAIFLPTSKITPGLILSGPCIPWWNSTHREKALFQADCLIGACACFVFVFSLVSSSRFRPDLGRFCMVLFV